MIELIFVACLSASPDDCQERSLLYTDMSPMVCLMAAQPELAKWVETHPRWQIQSWRCASVRNAQKDV